MGVKNIDKKVKVKDYGRFPNRLLYFVAAILLKAFITPFFHVSWKVDPCIKDLKPPVTVIANHPSYLDPFLVGCALYPLKINFIAASSFFANKKIEPLLYFGGAIPKTQFRADTSAIKSMFKIIKRGGVLGIFPEGARSIDGTSLPIEKSITKFIKKTGGSVVVAISHGAYLTWPRWSCSKFRRGLIELDIHLLFTSEQVESCDAQKLHSEIVEALKFDEYDWQKEHMVRFITKSPAKGLHNILHQCPSCKGSWCTDTTDFTLFCKLCGNTAIIDLYGFLHPQSETSVVFDTVTKWNRWQISELSVTVQSANYVLEEEAEMMISENESPYKLSGSGLIRLDLSGFNFEGTNLDGKINIEFPLLGVLGISSDFGIGFDLVSDKFTYRFILKNGQKTISFSHYLELLREDKKLN